MGAIGALVGIDVGTTNSRVIAFDLSGQRVTEEVARTPSSGPGLDPDQVWMAVAAMLEAITNRVTVLGVGVSAQLAMVLMDHQGRPTRPAMLWHDGFASDEAALVREEAGAIVAAIARRPVSAESAMARVRWLQRHEPDALQRARWLSTLKDFIVYKLCGRIVTDPANASFSQLFDIESRRWSAELTDLAGLDCAILPEVNEGTDLAGGASGSTGGLTRGTPVAVGGSDGSVGALGAGVVEERAVDIAGSTDVVYVVSDSIPTSGPEVIVNAFVAPGKWTAGGPTGLTGGAISWMASLLGHRSAEAMHAALDAETDRIPPGCDGLSFRTALTGERFPFWDEHRRGGLSGLSPTHTAAHLLRAAEEGSAFLVRAGLDALARVSKDVDEVVVVGGIAARREVLQLRADAWSRAVVSPHEREASSLGAAMLAGVAAGVFRTVDEATAAMVHVADHIEPRRHVSTALDVAYARWAGAD